MADIKILGKLTAGRSDGALLDDKVIVGGSRVVETKEDLDNLPTGALVAGVSAYVSKTKEEYKWNGSDWVLHNSGSISDTELNDALYIVDNNGNVIAAIDKNGINTVGFYKNGVAIGGEGGSSGNCSCDGRNVYTINKTVGDGVVFININSFGSTDEEKEPYLNFAIGSLIVDQEAKIYQTTTEYTSYSIGGEIKYGYWVQQLSKKLYRHAIEITISAAASMGGTITGPYLYFDIYNYSSTAYSNVIDTLAERFPISGSFNATGYYQKSSAGGGYFPFVKIVVSGTTTKQYHFAYIDGTGYSTTELTNGMYISDTVTEV